MGDHDAFFKRIFSNPAHAAGELASVLPRELVAVLDLGKLELIPGSFVDNAMRERHTDLMFRAPVRGRRRRGRPLYVYLYFIFEHLSWPDPLTPFRLNQYMDRFWARLLQESPTRKTLPIIIPLIVHHGPGGWRGPRTLHDMIDGLDELPALRRFVPNFELLIDDLALATDAQLAGRPLLPAPKVATWLLRDGRNVRTLLSHAAAWGPELERVAPGERAALLSYLLSLARPGAWDEVRKVIHIHAPASEASMISILDHFRQEGRQEGREEGREEGRQEGHATALRGVLRALLANRFGALPPEVDARIDATESPALEQCVLRVGTAARVEDVFDPH
jgi:predicted transposase YdaD